MISNIALILARGCPSDLPTDKIAAGQIKPPTRVKTLAECKKLSRDELDKYVEKLGEGLDYEALEELCRANIGYAMTVYTQILDDAEAIQFCKSFPVGSYEWKNASWGLSSHRKEAVIDYVKAVCNTKNPWVRGSCYSLCLKAGWDDLIENAKRDVNDDTPMMEAIGETLGKRARFYVEWLPEFQKALNRNKR